MSKLISAIKHTYSTLESIAPFVNPNSINEQQEHDGQTALVAAYLAYKGPIFEYLLQQGASPNVIFDHGEIKHTTLGAFIINDNRFIQDKSWFFQQVIARNLEIDYQDFKGKTVLMHAADIGEYELVNIILNNKPKLFLEDENSMTALDYAKDKKFSEIYKLLYQHMYGMPLTTLFCALKNTKLIDPTASFKKDFNDNRLFDANIMGLVAGFVKP